MPKSDFIYSDPSISNFTSETSPTPYGIYDNDLSFISESADIAKYVSKKLGITPKEFEEIMQAEPKSYKDYPNNEKKLKFMYGIYKRYFSDYMSSLWSNLKRIWINNQQWNQSVSLSLI